MEKKAEGRMRKNLVRGITCLAVGALAMMVIELIWDAAHGPSRQDGCDLEELRSSSLGYEDLVAYAFNDDEGAVGFGSVPRWFLAECFDPSDMGEVRGSNDGGVVGITSDRTADYLFRECITRFEDHGWKPVCGNSLRCSFKKDTGQVHWAYLDVSQVADSSVAVIVLEGER